MVCYHYNDSKELFDNYFQEFFMKKKFLLFICSLFLTISCFAQNTDPKYYSDIYNDYSGYAVALYLGNLKELDNISPNAFFEKLSDKLDKEFDPIQKVTKKNNWLFKKALNEWEYEKNEVYVVMCADSNYSTELLVFFVVINGKDDFKWKAYNFNEKDLERIGEIFNDNEEADVEITPIPSSEEYVSGKREIFEWYTSLGIIQTKTNEDMPATIRVDVALAYKKNDTAASEEITKRTVEIKAYLRRYFSEKTAKELRNTNNEDELEKEIKDYLNEKIFSSNLIQDVVFQQKDVIGGY